ncbi:MAG: fibronectin type III domain-containing protein, partial [Verrucomicrobiae bacterium]
MKNKLSSLPISLVRMSAVALLLGLSVATSWAQSFSGTYSFAGTIGNVASLTYNGTAIPNLTVGALTKVGVTTSSSSGNSRATGFGTGSVDQGAIGGTLDTGKYFEFTITSASGYTISNPTITFGVGRSATGPRQFEWRSSLDSYASAIPVTANNASLTLTAGNVLQTPDANSGYTGNTVSLTTSAQTTITFRLYVYGAEGAAGTGGLQGNLSFDGTLASGTSVPTVTASAATSISTTAATLNGNVTADGGSAVTDRGFCYNTTGGVTISDNQTSSGTGTGAYTLGLTSLGVNVQYFYRAYATNLNGTALSSETNFWTLANVPVAPVVDSPTATSLNVTLGAGDGNPATTVYAIQETNTAKYVQADGSLNTTAVYQVATTWNTVAVSSLSPSTAYTFRVIAKNGAGTNTAFGGTATGTTSVGTVPPSVTTQAATALTTISATLNGTVTASNGAALTDRGFFWQVNPGVTLADNQLSAGGTAVSAFSQSLGSLSVNTIYYYRAYAVNSAGTNLDSSEVSFYTLANPPTVPTVDGITGTTLNITLDAGDGNPANTVYAIQETNSGKYVQTNGTLGVSTVYQPAANWGTKTVTGLSGTTTYAFQVKAQNGGGVDTAFSPVASGTTLVAPVLVAGWDFQTTTTGGTAAAAAPGSPLVYIANFGSGTNYLDGSYGSSTWVAATAGNEVTSFGGTALNAGPGFATSTTSPACLALIGGTGQSANGKGIVFAFSMANRTNLVVSYAMQKTTTGFSSQLWEYSTDGTTWTTAETVSSIPTSFATTTLATITGLDNAPTAYLRLTVSGASSASGNNRLDNIQLNAMVNTTGSYTITATQSANGSITPSGVTTINSGASTNYSITP